MNAPVIKPLAMRDALLARIRDAMAEDPKLFFVTADFGSPVLDDIREKYAARFVNVGIAEQNLINVSAGLALEGFNVFAYAIAPFITMRCFEQIRVNLCLLSQVRPLSVTLIGVGAGYSYVVSGPTHQCYEDISIMRTLPGVRVMSPSDHFTAGALFDACHETGIRYLRLDAEVLPPVADAAQSAAATGFRVLRNGAGPVLVSTGYMTHTALKAADALATEGVDATLIDLVDLTRFDAAALLSTIGDRRLVVSMEEGFIGAGGLDALVRNTLAERGNRATLLPVGLPPAYQFELGSRAHLHEDLGIGPKACVERIRAAMDKQETTR